MRLVDTHCHLQSERYSEDREAVLEESLNRLEWLVIIGDDLPSSEAALALVRHRVYAVVGVHPYYAAAFDAAQEEALAALAARPGVVAIGEMGLDYFNEYSPRAAQQTAFRRQLEMACALGLPVAIHNRDADADTYPILKEFSTSLKGCIMHCFGSTAADAERYVELGFHISFAGNVTFPKAEALRDAARVTPLDRLLVETDAPFLAPIPFRGKRCEPHHVAHTAACLAELKGVTLEAFTAQTTANAAAVYGIAH
ncbi:MAG: TatD family hydrolase [Candidatus Hydrogenedentes bacterium]|nr:TatD family hydrolase [Candidatus Hydrogenedentota bacterium]